MLSFGNHLRYKYLSDIEPLEAQRSLYHLFTIYNLGIDKKKSNKARKYLSV